MLDYNIALVADACAAFSQAAHHMTLENIDGFFGSVVTTDQLIETWSVLTKESVAVAG
jgi:ureidoacrylate peracid hydrolase